MWGPLSTTSDRPFLVSRSPSLHVILSSPFLLWFYIDWVKNRIMSPHWSPVNHNEAGNTGHLKWNQIFTWIKTTSSTLFEEKEKCLCRFSPQISSEGLEQELSHAARPASPRGTPATSQLLLAVAFHKLWQELFTLSIKMSYYRPANHIFHSVQCHSVTIVTPNHYYMINAAQGNSCNTQKFAKIKQKMQ